MVMFRLWPEIGNRTTRIQEKMGLTLVQTRESGECNTVATFNATESGRRTEMIYQKSKVAGETESLSGPHAPRKRAASAK
jgi:hypothetical protein